MAALAGSWIALVSGLAGMRHTGETLSFAPRLPEELTRLAFKISLCQRRLEIDVTAASATYTLLEGEPIRITHHGEGLTASVGEPIELPIPKAAPASAAPTQPQGRHPVRRRPNAAPDASPGAGR